jgi:hypothetical protein
MSRQGSGLVCLSPRSLRRAPKERVFRRGAESNAIGFLMPDDDGNRSIGISGFCQNAFRHVVLN